MPEIKRSQALVQSLRDMMLKEHIDTCFFTKNDPHQSEYSAPYWNAVQFLSGFTGSAGVMAVTQDQACLWTDGRYTLQAEQELAGTDILLCSTADPDTLPLHSWLILHTPAKGSIGFEGLSCSAAEIRALELLCIPKRIRLQDHFSPLDSLWVDRPAPHRAPVFEYPEKYAGLSRQQKLQHTRTQMQANNASFYLLSSLDDIAWLLNLRGGDFTYAPLFTAYAVLDEHSTHIFSDALFSENLIKQLNRDRVFLHACQEIHAHLSRLPDGSTVLICPERNCSLLYGQLKRKNYILREISQDLTTLMKAVKNETETACWAQAMIQDGAAMVRFIKWLQESVGSTTLHEAEIGTKLTSFRQRGEHYLSPSFETIAGCAENGAVIHYHPIRGRDKKIEPFGFLLVDSGAQYMTGTTDITRTIVLGALTDQMKEDFTLVLKCHIQLAMAKFPAGTVGTSLDALARKPLWSRTMDYKHGTGHGIGHCLNVHEGPQRLSPLPNAQPLLPGMVVSNEPGLYRKGAYGIRTENLIQVIRDCDTDFGSFYQFQTMTWCPIDLRAILPELLSEEELQWLNAYHQTVLEKLSPALTKEEICWLSLETRALSYE